MTKQKDHRFFGNKMNKKPLQAGAPINCPFTSKTTKFSGRDFYAETILNPTKKNITDLRRFNVTNTYVN